MPILERLTDDEINRARPPGEEAGFGALSTARGSLPLRALEVQARITDLIAEVQVAQTFVNPHPEPIEATYVFPLPDRAAVTSFRMEVGGRVIDGLLRETTQARRDYAQALRDGRRAALAEETKPGVFALKVGNLEPGARAVVRLTLSGPLAFADGEATFRFPLVVAPRYAPSGPALVSEDDTHATPPVILPGLPDPIRLSLAVDFLPSALKVGGVRSSLHAVEETRAGGVRRVVLEPGARLDRDFLLRFRLAGDDLRTSLALQPDDAGEGGCFLLTLVPPLAQAAPRPRDVAFVLDRSGSMSGWKMVAARRALARMIDTLLDQDRFAVLAFDDRIESPPDFGGPRPVHATDRQRFRAVEFLAKVEARGGTEMLPPLRLAVEELNAGGPGRDRVLVLVTDGQVENEGQLLHELGPKLAGIRVFCLGIDQAVNAGLLNRLAGQGGGACELVESEDRLDEVMTRIHRLIGQPVLTKLRLDSAGLAFEAESVVPERLPDVFAGVPVTILGRYRGPARGGIRLQAAGVTGSAWEARVEGIEGRQPAVAAAWARGRLRTLEDRLAIAGEGGGLRREIVETSLRCGVLCRFTAFVAVDRSEVVNPGGELLAIVQPVEEPAGWTSAPQGLGSYGVACCLAAPASATGEEDSTACMLTLSGHAPRALRGVGEQTPSRVKPRGGRGQRGLWLLALLALLGLLATLIWLILG